MPSRDAAHPLRLATQAATLVRDARLLAAHLATAPGLLGSAAWLLGGRRFHYDRPSSELDVRTYGRDLVRIALGGMLSLPVVVVLLGVLGPALGWYLLWEWAPLAARVPAWLRTVVGHPPLAVTLRLLERALAADRFAAVSLVSPPSLVHPPQAPASPAAALSAVADAAAAAGDPPPSPAVVAATVTADRPEVWYLVNGVAEARSMVAGSLVALKAATGRDVMGLYNPSMGLGVDLLECLLGRSLDIASRPVEVIAQRLGRDLRQGVRVVLLAHSQGGIIASNVVRSLLRDAAMGDAAVLSTSWGEPAPVPPSETTTPLTTAHLAQLEVYTWASAADDMPHARLPDGSTVPFCEHFAAEGDLVARIGALTFSGALPAPKEVTRTSEHLSGAAVAGGGGGDGGVSLPGWHGVVHVLKEGPLGAVGRTDFQGHLLKEHLLPAMAYGALGDSSVFVNKYWVAPRRGKGRD
ncbi:hypothetical protein MMPV_004767 [Pyropia vietnamensis]